MIALVAIQVVVQTKVVLSNNHKHQVKKIQTTNNGKSKLKQSLFRMKRLCFFYVSKFHYANTDHRCCRFQLESSHD